METNKLQTFANNVGTGTLQTATQSLQKSGNPLARPTNWFINSGVKKVVQAPDTGGGGKWVCGKMKSLGLCTPEEFLLLVQGHLRSVFTHGAFASWYLEHGEELVALADMHDYRWEDLRPHLIEKSHEFLKLGRFDMAFSQYRSCIIDLWWAFGRETIPSPYNVGSNWWGTLKCLASVWFVGSIPLYLKTKKLLKRYEAWPQPQ